jgi:hypothetical protein
MPEREPDWDTAMELEAESRRDAKEYECPETSNGQHCGDWHGGGKCMACGQDGPESDDTAWWDDGEGEDMEGEHIVHHVRDPKGDEAAHG